jgi:hypothetical protein
MRYRTVSRATVLAVTIAVALSVGGVVAGQSEPGTEAPRTAWGDPDLQGVWSYASLTPLQRPVNLEGQQFYSEEEAASRNASVHIEAPPRPGDVGAYNVHWFDRGEVLPDRRTSLIIDPVEGRLPLNDEGRRQVESRRSARQARPADSWLDRVPWDRCLTYHGVPPVSTGYNNTYHIVQTPDHVAIQVENIHDIRIIPLDGRPALSGSIQQWNGDSRGHWDGNTLVVETANYSNQTEHRFPSTAATRAVERFTRIGPDEIEYEFTIEDPSIYTQPWTAMRVMPQLPDYVIYEYACHEGNYAMDGILGGARAQEREAQQ